MTARGIVLLAIERHQEQSTGRLARTRRWRVLLCSSLSFPTGTDRTIQEFKPRFIDGQDFPSWEAGPDMADYIKRLQSKGWQLVGHVGSQEYIFERELQ